MKLVRHYFQCAAVLLLATNPLMAAAATAPSPVNQMSQAAIQSAFQVLRRDYIRREDLTFTEINRAALDGLLARLNFGAEFVREVKDAAPPAARVISENLTSTIGYLRPTTCQSAEVEMIQKSLAEFKKNQVKHLILDLRSPAQPGLFETAAAMLELFVPEGRMLFKLKQLGNEQAQLFLSHTEPLWKGSLVVLVDADTNNVAEVIAAVLRDQHRALLIGSPTRGATVHYETAPVEDGWQLRFASAEMLLPDDNSVFRKGLAPDLRVTLDNRTKLSLFTLVATGSAKATVVEQPRPRFNETALVHGTNPELDEYVRRSTGTPSSSDSVPPRDTVLQRAIDMLSAADHLQSPALVQKGKSPYKAPASAPALPEIKRGEPAKP